ncbi:hypothetical protein TRFO_20687 [Tritrichomonas foetus]|uniref:Protein kinase domain-containing protein n=1 Tax=Tritrichomonas foetus TaxID=1144522 RepID=A0A1J4KJW6_9EUKA|nr:hypothetical protein TRFO_20687 [Tritrichomonas foetus]|eukprot:OHT10140.1 hypothetical protein TRFO_20687 [Tritrichomonas foetus]
MIQNRYYDIREYTSDDTSHDNAATLYLASEKNSNMKVLMKQFVLDDDELNEFGTEVQALTSISHPNIIRPIDVFEDVIYGTVVLPFAEGGDLFEALLNDSWHINDKDLRTFSYHLLSAVSTLHLNGIIHRDLKPENIVLTAKTFDPRMFCIIDAASSYIENFTDKMNNSKFRCSRIYAPPEYCHNNVVTEKFDIWSIGMILYLMVAKSVPFYIDLITPRTLKRVLENRNQLFSGNRWDEISDDMKILIGSFLSFDPNDRPTASEALNNFIFYNFSLECDDQLKIEGCD